MHILSLSLSLSHTHTHTHTHNYRKQPYPGNRAHGAARWDLQIQMPYRETGRNKIN